MKSYLSSHIDESLHQFKLCCTSLCCCETTCTKCSFILRCFVLIGRGVYSTVFKDPNLKNQNFLCSWITTVRLQLNWTKKVIHQKEWSPPPFPSTRTSSESSICLIISASDDTNDSLEVKLSLRQRGSGLRVGMLEGALALAAGTVKKGRSCLVETAADSIFR